MGIMRRAVTSALIVGIGTVAAQRNRRKLEQMKKAAIRSVKSVMHEGTKTRARAAAKKRKTAAAK
jgi:hypothetical protein